MKNIEEIKFNLTKDMIENLIGFNIIKEELKGLYNQDKNDDILLKIIEKEQELDRYRQKFIESFRRNNKKEIKEYIDIKKDKKWFLSFLLKKNSSFVEFVYIFY